MGPGTTPGQRSARAGLTYSRRSTLGSGHSVSLRRLRRPVRVWPWATIDKQTDELIGRCGLLPWTIDGRSEVEVAYLLASAHWGRGLGTEAARAVLEYGFDRLHLSRLICLIDPVQDYGPVADGFDERDVGLGKLVYHGLYFGRALLSL